MSTMQNNAGMTNAEAVELLSKMKKLLFFAAIAACSFWGCNSPGNGNSTDQSDTTMMDDSGSTMPIDTASTDTPAVTP